MDMFVRIKRKQPDIDLPASSLFYVRRKRNTQTSLPDTLSKCVCVEWGEREKEIVCPTLRHTHTGEPYVRMERCSNQGVVENMNSLSIDVHAIEDNIQKKKKHRVTSLHRLVFRFFCPSCVRY